MREAGAVPVAIDVTIVARRPAVAPLRTAMAARIAGVLGIDPAAVSIKATTSDGLGFAGTEGIAAFAVATVRSAP